MSNNDTPTFTDEEVLTIYLFGIMQQHTQIKAIDTYTKDHLFDWFPHLPTYAGYVRRLNRLSVVFTPWKAEYIGLIGAAEHDLTALRQGLPVLRDGHLYGDKIYADQPMPL